MSTRLLAGRYELVERIGNGGMAVVYKAKDRLLGRYVAIKILKPEFTKDLKFIDNFKRESQAAASLSHPNIVNVYDVGREGNVHYIVMELIEGEALSDLIRREAPLDYKRVIEITKQIASALSFAHKHQIIHRDVKPHNIMMTADGTAKITDFGIAKAVNASTLVGNTGTVMGSVHYFSPEQARGGYVDEKSDIYSLGIVMYEMLTSKVPFDGDNPVAVALMHINDEIVPPSQLVPGIPPRLEKIVLKATDRIQVNRYLTADDLLDALNNLEFVSGVIGNHAWAGTAPDSANKIAIEETEPFIPAEEQIVREKLSNIDAVNPSEEKAEIDSDIPESKERKKDKKPAKGRIKLVAIIAALIVAIPIVLLISNLFTVTDSESSVTVPDLRGYSYVEAKDILEKCGLIIKQGDAIISDDYDEGEVVSQDPADGRTVKKGYTVTVNVCGTERQACVPKLTGIPYSDAKYLIDIYGYKLGNVSYQASNLYKGIVISQSPEKGANATTGSYINLVISDGKGNGDAVMPQLLGEDIEIAKNTLEGLGLIVGEITYGESASYGINQVMWQSIDAGKTVTNETVIELMVSTVDGSGGQGGETEQNTSIPLTIDYSLANNQVFYLTVTLSDESGTRNIISNQQRTKDNGSETIKLSGVGSGSVTVIIDNNVVLKKSVDFTNGTIN